MNFTLIVETAEDRAAAEAAATRRQIIAAIDARVEDLARTLGYTSAAHLAGYAQSTVAAWAAEAQTFIAWRDAVWMTAIDLCEGPPDTSQTATLEAVLAALPPWQG